MPDLDSAIPLYQALAGVTDLRRFSFGDVELAWVGPFLLLSGNTAPYLDRVATILGREHPERGEGRGRAGPPFTADPDRLGGGNS